MHKSEDLERQYGLEYNGLDSYWGISVLSGWLDCEKARPRWLTDLIPIIHLAMNEQILERPVIFNFPATRPPCTSLNL